MTLALGLMAPLALAQDSDNWEHALAVYLWFADIQGTTTLGTDIEVEFDDLVDNLEMGFMGAYQARKGKWSIVADVLYLDLGVSETFDLQPPPPIPGTSVPVETDLDLEGWVLNLQVGYYLHSNDGFRDVGRAVGGKGQFQRAGAGCDLTFLTLLNG